MGVRAEEPGAPLVPDVHVRRLRLDSDEDRALCAEFECGDEEWELQVSRFITRTVWLPGREPERVLLAIDGETECLLGFGAWKHTTAELPQRDDPVRLVRICYFGLATAFKGAVDPEGRKWASRIYSTLENDARHDAASEADMPFELYCDRRNRRGLRFWTKAPRSFRIIGRGYDHLLRLVRLPPGN